MMAGLYCLQYDQQPRGSLNPPLPSAPKEDPKRTTTFRCYTDVVFERFFKHELDLEDLSSLKQILLLARNESDRHQLNDETGVEEWVEQGFEDFALKAEENGLSKGRRALERIRRQAVEEEGVFGVPSMVAGGELFFGNDRIDWLRRKLQQQLLALRC
ncbi:DSBA family thioredoxin domain containing protein [Balamuthia mandrillaris]